VWQGAKIASWKLEWPTEVDAGGARSTLNVSYDRTVFLMKQSTQRKQVFEQKLDAILENLEDGEDIPLAKLPQLEQSMPVIEQKKVEAPVTPVAKNPKDGPKTPAEVLERVHLLS
jgi:hypothetical protein